VGRADVIVDDLRDRWAKLDSVILNNTLQEHWHVRPDSRDQWSHCPVAPLISLYTCILGIRPLSPGFGECEIRPQLADLGDISTVAHTVRGPIKFESKGKRGDRRVTISMPPACTGRLVVNEKENLSLEKSPGKSPKGLAHYLLPAGQVSKVRLTQA
jgi:hypothetical protein